MQKPTHRLCITQRYKTVWEVSSAEEFENAFIDLVECYHQAYKLGGLTYLVPPDQAFDIVSGRACSSEEAGHDLVNANGARTVDRRTPIAVLDDWDAGIGADSSRLVPRERSTHHPFEARDHHTHRTWDFKRQKRHRYRHDIESFLYILIWVVFHCDLHNKRKLRTHNELVCWERATSFPRDGEKRELLAGYSSSSRTLWSGVQQPFDHLIGRWVRPLLSLFTEGRVLELGGYNHGMSFQKHMKVQEALHLLHSGDAWQETLGGLITYETIMAILRDEKDDNTEYIKLRTL